ncbi:hypothetical protein DYB28_016006, partial [Aphanomyces astaci]
HSPQTKMPPKNTRGRRGASKGGKAAKKDTTVESVPVERTLADKLADDGIIATCAMM